MIYFVLFAVCFVCVVLDRLNVSKKKQLQKIKERCKDTRSHLIHGFNGPVSVVGWDARNCTCVTAGGNEIHIPQIAEIVSASGTHYILKRNK